MSKKLGMLGFHKVISDQAQILFDRINNLFIYIIEVKSIFILVRANTFFYIIYTVQYYICKKYFFM